MDKDTDIFIDHISWSQLGLKDTSKHKLKGYILVTTKVVYENFKNREK